MLDPVFVKSLFNIPIQCAKNIATRNGYTAVVSEAYTRLHPSCHNKPNFIDLEVFEQSKTIRSVKHEHDALKMTEWLYTYDNVVSSNFWDK